MNFDVPCYQAQPSLLATDVYSMRNKNVRYAREMVRGWVAALLLASVACTTPNTGRVCSEGSCSNPEFPYCDAEGVVSGEPGTCIAVTCMPGTIETCLGDDALTCNAAGDGYERVPCALGCKATPTPHCEYIEPRYLPDVCDTPAESASLVITGSGSLDPNLDSTCNGGIVTQTGAPSICIVRHQRIHLVSDAVLRVTGKANTVNVASIGRAIAFVADDELSIEGTLNVGANGFINGPGAGLVVSGGPTMVTSSTAHVAGGGSGGKTAGASGGNATADGGAANGGVATSDPAFLAVLIGGGAAFRGNTGNVVFGGGGGGGAATLIACRGSVAVTGTINAGGGGGSGGTSALGLCAPGYGGGAGGYVVLQGKNVSVSGGMFANGGGGGAGCKANLAAGSNGSGGLSSSTAAAAGGLPENGEGQGGQGGVGSQPPTVGRKPTTSPATAGGGGGSVGFLQIYTPEGIEPMLSDATVSPSFQPNGTIKTR